MSSTLTVYLFTRLNGRSGSSTAGVSPNAGGGALPKSVAAAAGACCGATGAGDCAQVCCVVIPCCGGVTHCGC